MTTQAKSSAAALALVGALALGASSAAQAGHDDVDVFWSIAMSQPGLRVAVSNMPAAPVVVHERRHVHVYPQPVYVPPRVVYLPPPPPVYHVHPRHHHHHGHAYAYGHGRERHEHWKERWEERRDRGHGHGGYDRDRFHGERPSYGPAPHLGNGGQPRGEAPHLARR
jgi:hypothetical protein